MPENPQEGLTDRELAYYSRQIQLAPIGYSGQLRLKKARVGIIGIGGLGSSSAMQLAALGIGYLRLVDRDIVEISNLHRQYLYGSEDLGYPKVEVAARRLRSMNPFGAVEPCQVSLDKANAGEIVETLDVVIDGLDRMEPRYALNRACLSRGIPAIFGSAAMTFGYASTILPGRTPCLECFQGNLDDAGLSGNEKTGVHPSVPGLIASMQVAEAVRVLLGQSPCLAGRILYADLGNMEFRELEILPDQKCPACESGS